MKKKNTILKNLQSFVPVAHRGAPYEFPENTLPSLERALSFHHDIMLEIDVWETKDNRAIVLHDADFNRIADYNKKAKEMTLAEIKDLDVGNNITFDEGLTYPYRKKGYTITTLEDVLKTFPDTNLSIDIKYHNVQFANRVAEIILDYEATNRVIVGSFCSKIVAHVRKNFPAIATIFSRKEVYKLLFLFKLGLIKHYKPKDKILCLPEYANQDKPELQRKHSFQGIRLVTKKLVDAMHKRGIPVFVWTINRKDNMLRLISWGVDGIVTDYPDRLVEAMQEMGISEKTEPAKASKVKKPAASKTKKKSSAKAKTKAKTSAKKKSGSKKTIKKAAKTKKKAKSKKK